MIKDMIKVINEALFNNEMTIDAALQLLQQLSRVSGKTYGVNARRVVVYDEENKMHDAYVNA